MLAGLFSFASFGLITALAMLPTLRLDAGFARKEITQAIEKLAGPGARVDFASASISLAEGGIGIALDGLSITAGGGRTLTLDTGLVRLDGAALLAGAVRPLSFEVNGGSADLQPIAARRTLDEPAIVTGSVGKSAELADAVLASLLSSDADALAVTIRDFKLSFDGTVIENLTLSTAGNGAERHLSIALPADYGSGSISVARAAIDNETDEHRLLVKAVGLPLPLILQLSGIDAPVPHDAVLAFDGTVAIDRLGSVVHARLNVAADRPGAGISRLAFMLDWSAPQGLAHLDALSIAAPNGSVTADGTVSFRPDGLSLALGNGRYERASGTIVFDQMRLHAGYDPSARTVTIADFGLRASEIQLKGAGVITLDGYWPARAEGRLKLKEAAVSSLVSALAALDPAMAAAFDTAPVGGRILAADGRFALAKDDITALLSGHGLSPDVLDIKAKLADVSVPERDGAPAIESLDGEFTFRKGAADIALRNGAVRLAKGRSLRIVSLNTTVSPFSPSGPRSARIILSGPVSELADGLRQIPAASELRPALDRLGPNGKAELSITQSFRPARKPLLKAALKGVTIKDVADEADLENADLEAEGSGERISIKGDGMLFGLPAAIRYESSVKSGSSYEVSWRLDDKARRTLGLDLGPSVAGSAVVALRGEGDPSRNGATITVDMTALALRNALPGWSKPAGRPGSATMKLIRGKSGFSLEEVNVKGGGLQAHGRILLSPGGQIRSAAFDRVKMPGGETGSAIIERLDGAWSVALNANALDARPWFERLDRMTSDGNLPIALSADVTALQGHNGEIIAGATLRTSLKGGRFSDLSFAGTLNGQPVALRATPNRKGMRMRVTAGDAGGLLRFVDIYPRMLRGSIDGRIELQPKRQFGTVWIKDFTLQNEPALRGIAAQSGGTARDSLTFFSRGRLRFARSGERIEIREAVMWGNELGGNITGEIDYAGDRIALAGSFVPAYALNNFFAKLPLVGVILGGESYEGLFAVPFTITGKASAPRLTVNALSAVAPGILRKLLDFQRRPDLDDES